MATYSDSGSFPQKEKKSHVITSYSIHYTKLYDEPDIMSMAKAIGGGFPMGAIAARDGISFGRGQHASTFGGGPLACAAALASIKVIKEENPNVLEMLSDLGQQLFFPKSYNFV